VIKRIYAVLDTEVEEKLRYRVFGSGQCQGCGQQSGVELLAISGVRTYPLWLSSASILCTLISSIKFYRYYSDDDECKLAKEILWW
jgi:hypothetical protein